MRNYYIVNLAITNPIATATTNADTIKQPSDSITPCSLIVDNPC